MAAPHMNPCSSSSALRGVFVGDELTAQGLPYKALVELVNRIREQFDRHNIFMCCDIIYYNDSIFMATWSRYIPENLTHFSIDYHHGTETGRVGKTVLDLYHEFVFPRLGAKTKVLFVPQTFGTRVDPLHDLSTYENWILGNLTKYVE